jgi:hypothetical protein
MGDPILIILLAIIICFLYIYFITRDLKRYTKQYPYKPARIAVYISCLASWTHLILGIWIWNYGIWKIILIVILWELFIQALGKAITSTFNPQTHYDINRYTP